MKVIGYCGSPHKNGNTAWAVEQILSGAKQAGAETVVLCSSDFDITPCRGCFGCKSGDYICVIKDDMQMAYDELQDADALVFASPVYIGQMTGQAKVFMDRLFPINSPVFSPHHKEHKKMKLILVFTQGNLDKSKFHTYFEYTKQLFETLDYDVKGIIIIAGTRSVQAKDIAGLAETLFDAGVKLVE